MKKVMVLGAGVMQVPLIRTVKELGHLAVVVGVGGPYPGIPLADQVHFVDFCDAEAVERIARAEGIDGICTCGMDRPIPTLAAVSEAMGLPGIPAEAGVVVANKMRMKESFARGGVRTPSHCVARTIEDGIEAFRALHAPLIFKAPDSQGSKGIVRVDTIEQVPAAYAAVRAATRLDAYVVEEFIEGTEFGAQAFVTNGVLQFVLPHGDVVYQGDAGIPIGHFVPLDLTEDTQRDCREQLARCVEAIGLRTCAINADFILNEGRVYVLEIGARCGATMLAETVSLYYGFDYYEQIVRAALGETLDFRPRPGGRPNASSTLFSERAGTIVAIRDTNPCDPNILSVVFDKAEGDRVNRFRAGIDRIGHVIVTGDTLMEARRLLEATLSNIDIEIQ